MKRNDFLSVIKKNKVTLSITVLLCVLYLFIPTVAKELSYKTIVYFVNTDDANLFLYDYKVYGHQNVFDKKYADYVKKEKNYLKSKNEIAVVKIRGKNNKTVKWDYVLLSDENVPELNVEIYLAKNADFDNNSLPCKTVLVFLTDLLNTVIKVSFCLILAIRCLEIIINRKNTERNKFKEIASFVRQT